MTNLSKQVYIYSLSTDVFFSEGERKVKLLKDRYHDLKRLKKSEDKIIVAIDELKESLTTTKSKIEKEKINNKLKSYQRQIDYLDWLENDVFTDGKVTKAGLKRELNELIANNNEDINKNKSMRQLNTLRLNDSSVISLFESTLTRKMKMKTDELSHKMIVVEVYNYEVFKNLLKNGFTYGNHGKFVYYSSSSGQIRQKKAVFVHEETLKQIEDSLTNGLSVDDVNADGKGMSVNKFLAYRALTNSASVRWEKFHNENLIDHTIVVDDVEVEIKGRTVDYIDKNYKITRTNERPIHIEITDGAGMCLPSISDKAFQFRTVYTKGLICPVPFDEFTDNTTVTDIYGKKWDINKDQVKIILFKSQFKMWKKFIVEGDEKNSWMHFRENFKKNNCEAAICNVEEDSIPNAKTNYQYLQSLVKAGNVNLVELTQMTNDDIANMATNVDTMLRVLGAEDENDDKNEFQQAINLYPALLNDENSREAIKNRKKKLVEDAKAGKLSINGKFTYVLPDWVAVMQKIFLDREPVGLLNDGEVYCNLYDEGELDCLRSPSLSFEHVIRNNSKKEGMNKWYITKGIYVSSQDLISKVLQMDWDGDKLLVTPNKTLITLAKQNKEYLKAVPLDYEMGVAAPKIINPDSIFESLSFAFKGNIGIISNNISKVFNADGFNVSDYKIIKQLCAYNNHMIDMAKTLDLPQPPKEVKVKWDQFTKEKLPYLFHYAKGKTEDKLRKSNQSTVNRIPDFIINKRLVFKNVVGKFDYRKLLWKPTIKDDAYVISEEIDKKIIQTYKHLDRNKRSRMNEIEENETSKKKQHVYNLIREELLEVHSNPHEVADVLVRYLFIKESPFKTTLWESFGSEVVEAIRKNVHNEIDCIGCGEIVHNPRQRQVRCDDCQKEYRKKQDREQKKKKRRILKKKMSA